MTERQNVEIDYCPQCRGIWLDKGELDKLLEYSAQSTESNTYGKPLYNERKQSYSQDYERNDKNSDRNKYLQHGRKKKSFLSDFFDFD
ncbi:zf-TFIIB domain-containing protein [Sphingobacterium sp. UT-1RO-CII-1]|uniref:TFIIB-type zinc ribbon-containing protein n=1 Tax=Sphingobacterium sp. UT-1RO-CII-1 TaxID=2995225 RepID=UPI003FA39CF2